MMQFQFGPSNCPGLSLSGSAKIDVEAFEIDVPGVCRSQVDGKISSVDAEYSAPAGDRLSDSEGMQEDRMR
jgi:hypothetical protein